MSNSRKFIWIAFATFMLIQLGSSYLTYKNQNNMSFLMEMKSYLPYMLYFLIVGMLLFLLSFMVYQLDGIKAKKQIAQLEIEKNELKAKLFDMQEEASKSVERIAPVAIEKTEDSSSESKNSSETNGDSE